MSAAVVLKDLEWKYEHTTEFALKGVNLEIEENCFLGIVGANEHGKTSLISAISGQIPHSYNGIYRLIGDSSCAVRLSLHPSARFGGYKLHAGFSILLGQNGAITKQGPCIAK